VTQEVKDIFEYITRYKPQKISLDTKMKPFILDYIPAVGEVDAFLKMPRPDTGKEDMGISMLDEPALNCEDRVTLEMTFVQNINVPVGDKTPVTVESIESADKKPKEISRWI
jgi:intraflagellar transport protein 46